VQGEKSRLAVAIAACEAAAACISRPSSPQDPVTAPIPDKEIAVRVRLEDLIDMVIIIFLHINFHPYCCTFFNL
jgi:nesprin-1